MKCKNFFWFIVSTFLASFAYAATPVFTITPVMSIPPYIVQGQTAIGIYNVTNTSPYPLNGSGLVISQFASPSVVSQDTSNGYCGPTFNLGIGQSCLLKFLVRFPNASQQPITSGPVVCNTPQNPVFCSQPSSGGINTQVVASATGNMPTLSVPASLTLYAGVATNLQITNASATTSANNVNLILPTAFASRIQHIDSSQCATALAPGQSCTIVITPYSNATSLSSTPVQVQGANTQPATINMTIVGNSVAVQLGTQHMQYRQLNLSYAGTSGSGTYVSTTLGPNLAGLVHVCGTGGDAACGSNFQSTCTPGFLFQPNGATCYVWLKSVDTNTFHQNVSDTVTVQTSINSQSNSQSFNVSYNMGFYVVGGFFQVDGNTITKVAYWNNSAWSAIGNGPQLPGTAYSMEIYNGDLVVGGDFTQIGSITTSNIASWNGASWSALQTGVQGTIRKLKVYNGKLYVAGNFISASGVSANYIASWDGTNWAALGSGIGGGGINFLSSPVQTMIVYTPNGSNTSYLVVGGDFNDAGGVAALYTAAWNGSSWGTFGNNSLPYPANSLAVINDVNNFNELYVGLDQSTSIAPEFGIEKYSNSNWVIPFLDTMGNAPVIYAVASYKSLLYSGGLFSIPSGGLSIRNIASKDDSSINNLWSPLGPLGSNGVNGPALSFSVFNNTLYIAGNFSDKGNKIVAWDGSSWSQLGSGMNRSIYEIMPASSLNVS